MIALTPETGIDPTNIDVLLKVLGTVILVGASGAMGGVLIGVGDRLVKQNLLHIEFDEAAFERALRLTHRAAAAGFVLGSAGSVVMGIFFK